MNHPTHVLPPISRDGSDRLFACNPKQKKKIRSLIRRECCNYDATHDVCLALNDSTCPQMISNQILCRWFNHAVLPAEETLFAEIIRDTPRKHCASCGKEFVPGSNRARYCLQCRRKVHRFQKTASEQKRRSAVDR